MTMVLAVSSLVTTLPAQGDVAGAALTTHPVARPFETTHGGFPWVAIRVPIIGAQACRLQHLWKDQDGKALRTLKAAREHLVATTGTQPLFLCNAGIFGTDHTPEGLCIEAGKEKKPLNTAGGQGNFYLKPNGVFQLTAHRASILDTETFAKLAPTATAQLLLAVQSGPLLLDHGVIHPEFNARSKNTHIRNGVGVVKDGSELVLAISLTPVTLYEMAAFFQSMGCDSALYLDGTISAAWAPGTSATSDGGDFVGLLAVVPGEGK
jgi:uncharacterized protein YigE (DUF2233 family)